MSVVDRSFVHEWLTAQLGIWAGENIAAEHLLKLLANDVQYLPEAKTMVQYKLGYGPNKRLGFDHIHSGKSECGMAYWDHDAEGWAPCKKYVNHDDICGYADNSAF